jgi:hypothetical protein
LAHTAGGVICGTFLSQSNILSDFRTSAGGGTGGQVTGQGNGREDADHSHNDHEFDQGETLSEHIAGLALTKTAQQFELQTSFDER